MICFSLSPILSYYITTRKGNTVKEKGLRVVRKEKSLLRQQTTVCKVTTKSKAMLVLYFKQFVYLCNITETFNEMRDIRIEKGINKDNALLLCEWSNEQGKEFQEQWMVPKFHTRWTMIK